MSDTPNFVHLHFHTCYSLLDGATKVKEAVKQAKEFGMQALAITDHGVMYGAIEFYKAAKDAGIKPILGCEAYTTDNMFEKKKLDDGSQANHLILLSESNEGYQNLMKLVSAAHIDGYYYKPRIDRAFLAKHAKGLLGTTACINGEVTERVVKGDLDGAMRRAGEYGEIFGNGNYYIELQNHGMEDQKRANRGLIEISRKLGMPLICSNDCHYLKHDHAEAHDVMLCLQTGTTMSDPKRMKYPSDQFYMKSQREMAALFSEHPDALLNTIEIAERCNIELAIGKKSKLHFPKYDVPGGGPPKPYLVEVALQGLKKLYGLEDPKKPKDDHEKMILERLSYEVSIIERTGFIDYFLVVWDFIHHAKSQGIPVGPGRGSGAGSLVAYALGITTIDPLRYNLIFERFLNPDRVSPPDFDIDFCQERRGEVIDYVKKKYGSENCAQIATFGSMGAKSVIRDIGRALEIPLKECDRLAKLIPEKPDITLEQAEKDSPDFRRELQTNPEAQRIMRYARVLEGLPKSQGTHAAGVVIGDVPLNEILPLCVDKDKQPMSQFEMKPLEETGLLKMDFLGLKTLTVIREACNLVKDIHGVEIDEENLPRDEADTFKLLNRGDTTGVFQVESKGMRDLLRQFQVSRFEDLIMLIALYRPGPMDLIPDTIERRHGRQTITYMHPLLEGVLKETYGTIVYQEQVQQASKTLAGFTLAQGDVLRRAMGKKNPEEMAKQRAGFVEGCQKTNNMPPKQAGEIFDTIEKFASYGFNKSHSAAYAEVAYRTAYLKAHYPAEFMSALMSSEIGNSEKLQFFVNEARESGLQVLPPNVQEGGARFRPSSTGGIRFGMAGVKGVGTLVVDLIVAERKRNGPFMSFMDFCERMDSQVVNKRVLESLIKSGAFDWTNISRARLFSGIDFVLGRVAASQKDRRAGQSLLFDALDADKPKAAAGDEEIPECAPWPNLEMLKYEKELLGFYVSGHPLLHHKHEIAAYAQADIAALAEMEPGASVRVAGMVGAIRTLFTKKDQQRMASFRLEGTEGGVDAIMFPTSFKDFGSHVADGAIVLAGCEVTKEEGNLKLIINELYPVTDAARLFAQRAVLSIGLSQEDREGRLDAVKALVKAWPGITPLHLKVLLPGGVAVEVKAEDLFAVHACEGFLRDAIRLLGAEAVEVVAQKEPYKRARERRGMRRGP